MKTHSAQERRTKVALVDGNDNDDVVEVRTPAPMWKKLTTASRKKESKKTKNAGPIAGGFKKPSVRRTEGVGDFDVL